MAEGFAVEIVYFILRHIECRVNGYEGDKLYQTRRSRPFTSLIILGIKTTTQKRKENDDSYRAIIMSRKKTGVSMFRYQVTEAFTALTDPIQ